MLEMPWVLYLLTSTRESRTYVGVTTDLTRRLAQHNGERPGGAKATRRGRPWKVHRVLGAFPDRRSAQRAEVAFKRLKAVDRLRFSR